MTDRLETLKLKNLADVERDEFGPLGFYHPLVADGDTPVRAGIQNPAPGYIAQMHWHPYEEILFIIESETEAWLEGGEHDPVCLSPSDGREWISNPLQGNRHRIVRRRSAVRRFQLQHATACVRAGNSRQRDSVGNARFPRSRLCFPARRREDETRAVGCAGII